MRGTLDYDPSAELAVVLAVMANPAETITRLLQANLLPNAFNGSQYRALIQAGIQLFRESLQINEYAINGRLLEMFHANEITKSDYDYLVQLWQSELPPSDDIADHIKRVALFYAMRKASTASKAFVSNLKDSPTHVRQLLPAHMTELSAIAEGSEPEDPRPMAIYANKKPLRAFPSGFKIVDEEFGGWIRGRLSTVGGPTGHGKTAMACSAIANLIRNDFAVLDFTPEVEALDIINRVICNLANITYREATEEHADNPASEEARQYWIEKMQGSLRVYHSAHSISDILMRIRWHLDEFGDRLALVSVDYLQHLTGITKPGELGQWKGNEASFWGEAARRLHDAAISNGLHILLFAQFSEEIARRIKEGDISYVTFKGSGDVMNVTDFGWVIHRHLDKPNAQKVYLVKNRLFGNQRECEWQYDPAHFRFSD